MEEIPSNQNQYSSGKFIWLKWYSSLTWNASAVNAAAFCVYCPLSLFSMAVSSSSSFSIMGSLLLTLSSCSQAFTCDNNVGRISLDPTSNLQGDHMLYVWQAIIQFETAILHLECNSHKPFPLKLNGKELEADFHVEMESAANSKSYWQKDKMTVWNAISVTALHE